MSDYFIGQFEFINLSRAFSKPTMLLEREVRIGSPGVTFWRVGPRCEPFTLVSVVDVATVQAGEALLQAYEELVGGDPVPVAWGGVQRADILCVIHDVQPLDEGIHAVLLGIGGTLGGPSYGLCRAVWTVEPINPIQQGDEA